MTIQQAKEYKYRFSHSFNVQESAIVWQGSNRFLIVKDGSLLRAEVDEIVTVTVIAGRYRFV